MGKIFKEVQNKVILKVGEPAYTVTQISYMLDKLNLKYELNLRYPTYTADRIREVAKKNKIMVNLDELKIDLPTSGHFAICYIQKSKINELFDVLKIPSISVFDLEKIAGELNYPT